MKFLVDIFKFAEEVSVAANGLMPAKQHLNAIWLPCQPTHYDRGLYYSLWRCIFVAKYHLNIFNFAIEKYHLFKSDFKLEVNAALDSFISILRTSITFQAPPTFTLQFQTLLLSIDRMPSCCKYHMASLS